MTVAVCLYLTAITTNAQTLKEFFKRYNEDERFEYVSVGKGMLSMVNIFGEADNENTEILSKIKRIEVLTLTDGFDDKLQKNVQKELDEVINAEHFETLVAVREKTERVNVYYRITEKGNSSMLVVTKDESELCMIWLKGKLSQEELMEILDEDRS